MNGNQIQRHPLDPPNQKGSGKEFYLLPHSERYIFQVSAEPIPAQAIFYKVNYYFGVEPKTEFDLVQKISGGEQVILIKYGERAELAPLQVKVTLSLIHI